MEDRRLGIGLVAIMLATLAGATLLYSGAGPLGGAASATLGGWHPVLGAIARSLTLPLPTAGIADVRDVCLFVGLACGALLAAVAAPRMGRSLWESYGAASPGLRWLIATSVMILIAGLASAWVNGSMDLSRGWLLRFAAGAGWAWLLGRYLGGGWVRLALCGMVALGAVACGLALWHRADHGVRYFSWPIGPLTITAGLAGVWAAMAGGWLLGSRQTASREEASRAGTWHSDSTLRSTGTVFNARAVLNAGAVIVVGLMAAYVLQQSGRRAAMLGCIAAVGLVLALRLWRSGQKRQARRWRRLGRAVVIAGLVAAMAGAAWYVRHEAGSAARERAVPVALRFGYLRICGGLISQRPLLGAGPDMSVAAVTSAVAPLRADMPHVYHGHIDAAVHNEWAQAAVELGVPAALAYLALPIGLLAIALRRAKSSADAPVTMALAAGVVAIVVTEAGSITLRGPIMPPWYWTLLGLLIAAGRPRTPTEGVSVRTDMAGVAVARGRRVVGLAAAALCAVFAFQELVSAAAASRPGVDVDGRVESRLYAEKALLDRYRAAEQALWAAQARPVSREGRALATGDSPDPVAAAVTAWHPLYELAPGLGGVIENYARALLLAGKTSEARQALRRAIDDKLDPYSAGVNVLYARLPDTPPLEQYRCVLRALRSSAMDAELGEILRSIANQPDVIQSLANDLTDSGKIVLTAPFGRELDRPTMEAMRIKAFLLHAAGSLDDAVGMQRYAASVYRRLEKDNNPYRRAHAAEVDAFERLARWLLESWRARHVPADATARQALSPIRDALDAIRAAERYAVLGLPHDRVMRPRPEWGFVFGEVIPTAFPERLRPLWRLSALLHLMAGEDRFLDFRIYFSLPPVRWTPRDMQREMAAVAREAVVELSKLPAELRPKHFAGLQALAAGVD